MFLCVCSEFVCLNEAVQMCACANTCKLGPLFAASTSYAVALHASVHTHSYSLCLNALPLPGTKSSFSSSRSTRRIAQMPAAFVHLWCRCLELQRTRGADAWSFSALVVRVLAAFVHSWCRCLQLLGTLGACAATCHEALLVSSSA